jgi:putative RNA 2'-phosphotransferase
VDSKRQIRVSKFLSKHLRHAPDGIGLVLDAGGWVSVDAMLVAAANHGCHLTREELSDIVVASDKQRFAFDETGSRIRASQGHSIEVDLQLDPADPPEILYHGTTEAALPAILTGGLLRMQRHHVHLSQDAGTAARVGTRHGEPVVLVVASGKMAASGFQFFVSANGVWLVDAVPPEYLTVLSPENLPR